MEICLCQQQQAGGKRKKTAVWKIKKKKVHSYLSDRTDEAVIFWSVLLLMKAEEKIEGHKKCNGLDSPTLEWMKGRQKFEPEVTPGAQPRRKQWCTAASGLSVTAVSKSGDAGEEAARENIWACVAAICNTTRCAESWQGPSWLCQGKWANSHCSAQMMWAWTAPHFGYKATEKEAWCSQTAPKIKEDFKAGDI